MFRRRPTTRLICWGHQNKRPDESSSDLFLRRTRLMVCKGQPVPVMEVRGVSCRWETERNIFLPDRITAGSQAPCEDPINMFI